MRATPRAALARSRLTYRRTPLRVRLVAVVLVLVVAALAGSGIAATGTMTDYLINRVDVQLRNAAAPIAGHSASGDADAAGGQLPSLYVVEELDSAGRIVSAPRSALVDPGEPLPHLPRVTGAQSEASGIRTFTVHAMHGHGRWRVLSQPTTLADGLTGTRLIAQSLDEVDNTVGRLRTLLLIIDSTALLIMSGVGYLVVRASLRPLRAVENTAAQIAAGDLGRRVPDADARTEVGQLAGAFNTMLGRIETAFEERAESERAARSSEERMRVSEAEARLSEERMRSFVADASHELRTPLTTIRGFAELYRQGAVADGRDVDRLMSRIEGEATRMGLLVEDLLLLARLDQERPLANEPVDLLALVWDAVQDARVLAPDRPIALVVGCTDPPPVVDGDDARLRQVLSNLLSNAVTHTPAGTGVTVMIGTGPGEHIGIPAVTVSVIDEGPGLTTEAAARVFERFYRVDGSRSRNDGGSGLGLAIVAALVGGHGGYVDVESDAGSGARFTVELPLADVQAHRIHGS